MDVGFVGLGMMGRAMARNLARAGHRVVAWNRSPVELEGIAFAAAPVDAFQADAVFTMLADDAAIRSVVLDGNLLGQARAGCVHVVAATISVALAEELRARHEAAGLGYVAAPVFGRPDVAAAGQLAIVAAGRRDAVDTVRPLLDVVGRRVWVLGEDPPQANAAKIAGNMMIAMAIGAMAEAVALTGRNGVAPGPFLDLMLGTLFGGRAYETYAPKILSGDLEPGFRMRLGLKDLDLARAAAGAEGSLPMLEAVRARMAGAVAAGLGDKDWSAIASLPAGPEAG